MAVVHRGRFTADTSSLNAEVVVFVIGMRIATPWKVRAWWPVFVAMPKMLGYLEQHPEKGLLGYQQALLPSPLIVQYWRSFDDLARFARDRDDPHLEPWSPGALEPWRQFNRRVTGSGDVGIWHETYRVDHRRRGDDRHQHAGPRSGRGHRSRAGASGRRLGCRSDRCLRHRRPGSADVLTPARPAESAWGGRAPGSRTERCPRFPP
ncbi:MAG: DUF4188 domain-containing protein [Nocardioides sp.]|nr:DUF4188 domain-containing protein [Nocardioides sp.]